MNVIRARLAPLLAVTILLALSISGQDLKTIQPQGYVSDFAGVLDGPTRAQIEAYCGRLEQATGVQMAIVTVKTLNGEPIEDVANSLFRRWGIGQKGKDEGLLLLVAVQDRKNRIEVGYGLEPILPDGFDGSILRSIRPELQQGNYSQALLNAAEQMGSRIAQAKGVSLDSGLRPRQRVVQPRLSIPWPLVIIGLIILFSVLGRGGRGGGSGGFLTGMILGNVLGRSGRWNGGGFGGYDSGGGGGGFGGFGGGDSGGGGASSDW